MDVEGRQLGGAPPTAVAGTVAAPRLAADGFSSEADRELLSHLAVAELDDVCRVRVDADQADDLDRDPGLLLRLAHGRLGHRLAELVRAAGQRVEAAVGALDHEQTAA